MDDPPERRGRSFKQTMTKDQLTGPALSLWGPYAQTVGGGGRQQRADSPVPSSGSMKSDWSMVEPVNFKDGSQSIGKR